MADKCPACGAGMTDETKYCTYYECGSKYPIDWDRTQSEECKKREAEMKTIQISTRLSGNLRNNTKQI